MAFTQEQHEWLETAQNKSVEFVAAGQRASQKSAKLAEQMVRLETLREELTEANQLTVEWDEEVRTGLFKKSRKQMEWHTGDRDEEIDTVHDLVGDYHVDPEAVKKLMNLHEELVKLQTEMENAKDEAGEPLFTARDIERELWSPLVRADIIPSNAVGDKYSQEAQVFNGACEIYNDILTDYTKNSSKHDQLQRGLRIAMDTASMIGAVAAESIKAANFEGMTITREETDQISEMKGSQEYKDAAALPADQRSTEQAAMVSRAENYDARKVEAATAKRDLAITSLTVAVVNGGLGVAEKALDKPDKKKGWVVAEKVFDEIGKAALGSMSLASAQVGVSDPTTAKSQSFKTIMASSTSLINYGFKAGKVVFRVHDIVDAPDAAGRKKAALKMVEAIAGAIENAFAAFDTKAGKDSTGEAAEGSHGKWAIIGAAVGTAIKGAANTGVIAEQVVQAIKSGKVSNPGALAAAVGMTVIAPIMAGVFKTTGDAVREDLGTGDSPAVGAERQHQETALQKQLREEAIGAAMSKIGDTSTLSQTLMESFPTNADSASMRRDLAKKLEEEELEAKEEEISAFAGKLKDNEEYRREFMESVGAETERQTEELRKLIEDATGGADDLEDEEAAKRAMDSIDKLIAEAQACNTKWQMIESMTSGGASILVAALPAAGLVAAIQKLVMDIAVLVKKSAELNKWLDNLALTYGNSSVYGPAIKGRVHSARVQYNMQKVRLVFDTLGVVSESFKMADCLGIATGISIANNMARALTEWGYKMEKEAEIEAGWRLYKEARESPGDRKKARKAMKWNSTLSKCVIAYGIVMDGDPIAKDVGRSCGLTPEILADKKDVCTKVVTYFQTLYSDDPVVMRRIPLKQDWHPGAPLLQMDNWLRFKAAAIERAKPSLAPASGNTPSIDKGLALLKGVTGSSASYAEARDEKFPDVDILDLNADPKRGTPEYREFLNGAKQVAEGLIAALKAYDPQTGEPDEGEETPWTAGIAHAGMGEVVDSLVAQAMMLKGEIDYDLGCDDALLLERAERAEQLTAMLDEAMDDALDEEETEE